MQLSIRKKILLFTIVPITAIYILALGWAGLHIYDRAAGDVEARMTELAWHYAHQFDAAVREAAQIAETTATFVETHPEITVDQVYEQLRANVQQVQQATSAAMSFEPDQFDGRELFSPLVYRDTAGVLHDIDLTQPEYGARDYRNEDTWVIPRRTGKAYWSEPFLGTAHDDDYVVIYCVPFKRGGDFWGVTYIGLWLPALNTTLESKSGQRQDFVIITRKGQYVYHPEPDDIVAGNLFREAEQLERQDLAQLGRRITSGDSGVMRIAGWEDEDTQWIFYAPIKSVGWGFAARISERTALAGVHSEVLTLCAVLLLSWVLIVACVWFVSDRVRKSEQQFRSLVENMPGITYRTDGTSEGRILYVGGDTEEFCGYPIEYFRDKTLAEAFVPFVHPEDLQRVIAEMEAAVAGGKVWLSEYRMLHRDGSVRWVRDKARPMFGPDNSFRYIDGVLLDITDRKDAEMLRARQALEAVLLHRAAEMAAETDSFDEALQQVVDMVCELMGWPVGHVYVPSDDDPQQLVSTTIWHLEDAHKFTTFREVTERTGFARGEGLPGRILDSGGPAWIANVQVDTNFPRNRLASDLGVKSAFGFPVKIGDEIVAILEFFTDEEMTPDDSLLQIMRNAAGHLSRVFERRRSTDALKGAHARMKRDLEAAARVQQDLLPTELPQWPGVRFAWHYEPCDELAGDILNVFNLDDRHIGFYVLDVCGHGVPAALLSVAVNRVLSPTAEPSLLFGDATRANGNGVTTPLDVALQLNRLFPFNSATRQYFTIAYGILDMDTLEMHYVLAGQPPPILARSGAAPAVLDGSGMPIGITEEPIFGAERVQLQPGDRLLLYSDGVTEAMNRANEMFGAERLCTVYGQSSSDDLENGVSAVLSAVKGWTGDEGLDDDLSLLAIEITSSP